MFHVAFLVSPTCVACPTQIVRLDMIILASICREVEAMVLCMQPQYVVTLPPPLASSLSLLLLFSTYALQPSRLIVRSGLDVPTFATRRLHACHHARALSGGRWNCGREMSGNFA